MARVYTMPSKAERETIPAPRKSKTITFCLPLEMAERVQQVISQEARNLSELVREARRLYTEERG